MHEYLGFFRLNNQQKTDRFLIYERALLKIHKKMYKLKYIFGRNMEFFSIGSSCQVAYQIRRYTNDKNAYYFDWVSSRKDSYKAIFLNDQNIFMKDNCKAVDKKEYSVTHDAEINFGKVWVLDEYTKLFYQHEFECIDGSNIIDDTKIEAHLPIAKSKFIHLKNKTLKAIRDSREPILVRYENIKTNQEAINLAEDINDTFKHLNKNLNVVIVSCLIDQDYSISEKIKVFKINKSNLWMGDEKSWDRVFATMLGSRLKKD